MKTVSFLILALGLAFTGHAADTSDTGGKKQFDDATIKKYDTNGDGKLDRNELAAMRRDLKKDKAAKKTPALKPTPGLTEPGVPLVPTK